MAESRSNLINVGRLGAAFGVKGWIKVHSSTEPKENIVKYAPWWLKTPHGVKLFEVDDFKFRNDSLVVHLKGVDDRDLASQYSSVNIAVERSLLPELEGGDYYWHQLIGLKVISEFDGNEIEFGEVKELLETGANDVLVISASGSSIDDKERIVPYILDSFVKRVDLEAGEIRVDWDPEF